MRKGITPLLLAGLAAFGYYKYSKMSEEEKNNLKEKGKKFFDENLGGLKNMFGQKETAQDTGSNNGRNGFTQA